MSNTTETTETSGVLFEEGVLLSETIHDMLEQDADMLCRLALRYRGILAELVAFRSVNDEEDDAGADRLVESAAEATRAIEFATASLRDFDDDIQAYALDEDEGDDDDALKDDDGEDDGDGE